MTKDTCGSELHERINAMFSMIHAIEHKYNMAQQCFETTIKKLLTMNFMNGMHM